MVGELEQGGGGARLAPGPFASQIAAIWSEILGLEAVAADADFFELGGDSLAAVRMLAAVTEQTSVELDFVEFLDRPTVNGLASVLERDQTDGAQAPPDAAANPAAE